jgi:hypothetical protein
MAGEGHHGGYAYGDQAIRSSEVSTANWHKDRIRGQRPMVAEDLTADERRRSRMFGERGHEMRRGEVHGRRNRQRTPQLRHFSARGAAQ